MWIENRYCFQYPELKEAVAGWIIQDKIPRYIKQLYKNNIKIPLKILKQ